MTRIFTLAALAFLCASARAQTTHAPDGGVRERLMSIDVPEKPGAPFKATVVTSWKRRLEDGTETTIYNHRIIARDNSGRVFQERRYLSPEGKTQETRISEWDYYDPIRKEITICTPMPRRCDVRPGIVTEGEFPQLPPTSTRPDGATVTRESLGTKQIENLEAKGSREIMTGGVLGKGEPTIKEFWYSPRLGLNLVVRRFEPRGGAQDFVVQNIELSAPDDRLFQLPQGFKVFREIESQ